MTDLLDDCYLKLDRADEHLESIEEKIEGFLSSDPYNIVGKVYPGSPNKLHYIATGKIREQPPKELRVLIGDFLHNMRSSLDTLADTLATDPSGNVPDGTEFPIFKDRALFFARKKNGDLARGGGLYKMRGLSSGAQTMVKWLQPYRRINDPEGHPLWNLHRLNAGDKHRRPHLTGTVLEGASFAIKEMNDLNLHIGQWGAVSGPFKNGTTVGTFSATVTGSNPIMDVDTDFTFGIAFDPKGVTRGAPVVAKLSELRDFVRSEVFPKLEPFV